MLKRQQAKPYFHSKLGYIKFILIELFQL